MGTGPPSAVPEPTRLAVWPDGSRDHPRVCRRLPGLYASRLRDHGAPVAGQGATDKGGSPGLPERRVLSGASCFPTTHRVLERLWPKDVWTAGLCWVSPGSSQDQVRGLSPASRPLHLCPPPAQPGPPSLRGPCLSVPSPARAPRAGVQPAAPGSHRAGSEARRAVSITKPGIP